AASKNGIDQTQEERITRRYDSRWSGGRRKRICEKVRVRQRPRYPHYLHWLDFPIGVLRRNVSKAHAKSQKKEQHKQPSFACENQGLSRLHQLRFRYPVRLPG